MIDEPMSSLRLAQGRVGPTGLRATVSQICCASSRGRVLEWVALSLIGSAAALLLFWNLNGKYLWQDEANTAVLAVRMLKYGRPLGYDGRNLLTNDNYAAEDLSTIGARARDPKAAVEYYIKRGDLRPDTSWIFHPWGQFIVAASGIEFLGRTTLGARLPFALAGLAAVAALYWLVRSVCGSALMALIACALLTGNAYWILHARQARYYSLSSLFLVLTLLGYFRWQRGARCGEVLFLAAAWCWFQVDYGTIWPVFTILFLESFINALVADRRNWWRPIAIGAILASAIAPFAYYYELWRRRSVQNMTWEYRFNGAVFNINHYVVPGLIVLAAAVLILWRWRRLPELERRLVSVSCTVIVAMAFWVPSVAPDVFMRYVVTVVPLGCLLAAWALVHACGSYATRFAWLGAVVLAFTPWLCLPLEVFIKPPVRINTGSNYRAELSLLGSELFGYQPDPNRLVVEWLQRNAAPTDEILINYEDMPLMFYLPNPIRGGVPAFRVEDDSNEPPRFAVMRSVPFVNWDTFLRELNRYQWQFVPLKAPDVIWGDNPDPMGKVQDPATARDLFIVRRLDRPTH